MANQVAALARYSDPLALVEAERRLLAGVADILRAEHFDSLAHLIELQPRPDRSLLAVAVRYYFRRSVEDDPKLFQGLAFAQLEQLQEAQEEGLGAIQELLTSHGEETERLLGEVQADVFATFNAVLDVQEEQKRQSGKHDDIYQAVIQMQQRLDLMRTELRPRDSLSIRGEVERQLVKELVSRYRALPEDKRNGLPALLNAVGKLQVAAGEFQAAERDFVAVAELVNDPPAKAQARFQRLSDRAGAARLDHGPERVAIGGET